MLPHSFLRIHRWASMKGTIMLGATVLGLNSTGWLKETIRSQREYVAETSRAAMQEHPDALRAAQRCAPGCCATAAG
jgi:hypothetical protein